VGLVVVTACLGVASGGEDVWVRLALGGLAAERCWAACRHRAPLSHAVLAAVLMLMLLPDDARLDRTATSAIGAVLLLAASESAHVARRLVTVAPVRATPRELWSVARLAIAGVIAVTLTAAVGSADEWIGRALIVGLAIAAAGVAWLARDDASEQIS
jgi:hypothetical protein